MGRLDGGRELGRPEGQPHAGAGRRRGRLSQGGVIRLSRRLPADWASAWPAGVRLAAFEGREAAAHGLLAAVYAERGRDLPAFDAWRAGLVADAEYAPDLFAVAVDAQGGVAGLVHAWTGDFVKDLAVRPDWRRRGLGAALMAEICARLAARGGRRVELKTDAENDRALSLYRRLGFAAG